MFIVLLRFSDNKAKAAELMAAHNQWVQRGFDDGVFLFVGSLQPSRGGGVIAHQTSLDELRTRVEADPFVAAGVVQVEILELTPARTDERLSFLRG
jgi:uncharacterized protein YciI